MLDAESPVKQTARETGVEAVRWEERPLPELLDHIVSTYHRPLERDLQHLEGLARKVAQVHQGAGGLGAVADSVSALREELLQHLLKEERVLFPWIRSGRGRTAGAPVAVMLREHEATAELLRRIRALTRDFVPPPEACASWRRLWLGLEVLERDLREHMRLEDSVLFQRALAE